MNTRENILNSAEVLFAREGYRGVSIREITSVARCNQALVNYHFGNKQNLYLEVFRSRWLPREKSVIRCFEEELKKVKNPTPAQVLECFARTYMDGPLSEPEKQLQRLLVTRELANPGEAFKMVEKQVIRPLTKVFLKYLRSFLPEEIGSKKITLYTLSVFAMVVYFTYSKAMVSKIMGRSYTPTFKKEIVRHLVDFSLSGLPLKK